ncbi:MAG TPA: exosortase system-associated protein, TIGR04073 family [Myxococcota bacterium]|nr:exosortase system-associated protein, TIGR04073 family [Myxococcota bacterium]
MKIKCNRGATLVGYALAVLVVSLWSTSSSADTAMHKAGRGLAAMTTPFLELPGNIIDTSQREGPIAGWTEGVAKGIGMTVVRPVVGLYELVTAPWAAPKNYEPILQPEYPWSYFGDGEKVAKKSHRESKIAKH